MSSVSSNVQVPATQVEPIVKSVVVALPVQAAFELFTAGAGRWWPLASHSVGGDDARTCVLEGRVGGRFYEVGKDGSEHEWGRVLAWQPPQHLVMSFYPGRTAADATEVEVNFRPEAGGTRLTLVHRGWERCSPERQAERSGYVSGWDYVLGRYLTGVARP